MNAQQDAQLAVRMKNDQGLAQNSETPVPVGGLQNDTTLEALLVKREHSRDGASSADWGVPSQGMSYCHMSQLSLLSYK